MTSHRVFFSFEYNKDFWRAVQIRNLDKVSDDFVFPDHVWEEVTAFSTLLLYFGFRTFAGRMTVWLCSAHSA